MTGMNMDYSDAYDFSDGIDNWGSEMSLDENQYPDMISQAYNSSHVSINASANSDSGSRFSQGGETSNSLPHLLSDSDSDDERFWNNLAENYSSGSSDTSDDFSNLVDISDVSDDSSVADDDDEYGVFEMLDHHFNIFNTLVPSFFGMSLQMLYARIMETMTSEEEKESPTPQHILELLPSLKVSAEQVGSNMSCCICFCDYILNEDLLKLPCSHLYHKTCILDWLKIKCTCPTCRLDLTSNTNDSNEEGEIADYNLSYSSSRNLIYRININDNNRDMLNNRDLVPGTSLLGESASEDPNNSAAIVPDINNTRNSNVVTDQRTISPTAQNPRVSNNRLRSLVGGPSNSNTIEMSNNDKVDEQTERSTSSTVEETKRFSRETEIW